MTRQVCVFTLVLAVLAGCTPALDMERELEALKEADRVFYQETAARGVDGWVGSFAPDGVMFRNGEIMRGEAVIRDMMAPAFANPSYSLTWNPEYAELSKAADLGYTIGSYESRVVAESGDTLTSTGRYVTIWRRDADGTWKAVLDIGSPREEGL